jgi:hypothetical protein
LSPEKQAICPAVARGRRKGPRSGQNSELRRIIRVRLATRQANGTKQGTRGRFRVLRFLDRHAAVIDDDLRVPS